MTAPHDTSSRLMLVLTALTGAMVLLAGYVALVEPQLAGALSCDPLRPDEDQCPAGQWCMRTRCEPREEVPVAARGERCHDRRCEYPMTCGVDMRCHPADAPATPALTCQSPEVQRAIARLSSACRQRKQSIQDRAQSEASCSADEWRSLLASDAEMSALLAAFPDRFPVFFPAGEPRRKLRWPEAHERAHLVEQIATHRDALQSARMLFVIGRASRDGRRASDDHDLALRRINLVERLLDEVLGRDEPSSAGAGPLLVAWGAPGEHALELGVFVQHYAGRSPPITASPADSARLARAFEAFRAGEPVPRRSLEREVNRVVLVIPVPCALGQPEEPRP